MRLNAIIIGCGNIGALYDIENNQLEITTYINAISRIPEIDLTICDTNTSLLKRLSKLYKCSTISNSDHLNLKKFDIVCIALPTEFHFKFLKGALNAGVPLILLEKPIVSSLFEIEQVEKLVNQNDSFILVNYYRRFQPAYVDLKEKLNRDFSIKDLSNIVIKYNRGFYNNCSHAIDLIGWLMNIPYNFSNPMVLSRTNDTFPTDPTINLTFNWSNAFVSCSGITNTNYYILDIELYFKNGYILLLDGGDKIVISLNGKKTEQSMFLSTSLKYVIDYALLSFNEDKSRVHSNIQSSIEVLKAMMKVLK